MGTFLHTTFHDRAWQLAADTVAFDPDGTDPPVREVACAAVDTDLHVVATLNTTLYHVVRHEDGTWGQWEIALDGLFPTQYPSYIGAAGVPTNVSGPQLYVVGTSGTDNLETIWRGGATPGWTPYSLYTVDQPQITDVNTIATGGGDNQVLTVGMSGGTIVGVSALGPNTDSWESLEAIFQWPSDGTITHVAAAVTTNTPTGELLLYAMDQGLHWMYRDTFDGAWNTALPFYDVGGYSTLSSLSFTVSGGAAYLFGVFGGSLQWAICGLLNFAAADIEAEFNPGGGGVGGGRRPTIEWGPIPGVPDDREFERVRSATLPDGTVEVVVI